MKSWSTQLCEKFFSSFFHKGTWKGDRNILMYSILLVWKKFNKESVDDKV